ncbi:hypothetical protein PQQ53_08885 [Paraburkholderia strydomiana]|uniref:hypothetical protein n=1 Tax=Paraburkholderia strydomiana TaxID=1245417 RepID=UPI0038BB9900
MTSKPNAVFLHSGYRTAGTWLWSRFRRIEEVVAYYEPLHEMLASIDSDTLEKSTADSWPSGHPELERPYFTEYAALLEPGGRGIAGFDERFAIDSFTGEVPDDADRIEGYVRRLIDSAHARGKVPVFKFCRSLGRLPWFRSTFADAVHIVVEKNPISQWQSCWDLFALHGNAHFVAIPYAVLASNRHVPTVARVLEALRVELPHLPTELAEQPFERRLAFFKQHVGEIAPTMMYRAFLAHWLLTLRHAATHAHAVFDCDLAVHSSAYALAAEGWVADLTGLTPSFGTSRRAKTEERHSGFDAVQGLKIHLEAMHLCKELVRSGAAHPDTYSLWASKLAQATQVLAFGAEVNWPQAQAASHHGVRIVNVALIDGADIDTAVASELAVTRTALANVRQQLASLQESLFWRLSRPVRQLLAAATHPRGS